MPIISKFYGIIIKMFFQQKEHNPPHIHAIYGEYAAIIDIQKAIVLEGDLPPKAQAMVIEWTEINKDKLLNIWNTQEFIELPPLE